MSCFFDCSKPNARGIDLHAYTAVRHARLLLTEMFIGTSDHRYYDDIAS